MQLPISHPDIRMSKKGMTMLEKNHVQAIVEELDEHAVKTIVVDGRQPVSLDTVNVIASACDQLEDSTEGTVAVVAWGYPIDRIRTPVSLVSKWERVLRRLERVQRPTVTL